MSEILLDQDTFDPPILGSLLCVNHEDFYAIFVLGGNSYCRDCFKAKKALCPGD